MSAGKAPTVESMAKLFEDTLRIPHPTIPRVTLGEEQAASMGFRAGAGSVIKLLMEARKYKGDTFALDVLDTLHSENETRVALLRMKFGHDG